MRTPIFQIQNHKSFKEEYLKIMKVLSSKCVLYDKKNYTYFDFIDTYLFQHWNYRGTYLDCSSYLLSIGIDLNHFHKIHEEAFFNFLEFLLNIQLLMESMKKMKSVTFSDTCQSILFHNIPYIIEEMGYSIYDLDDQVYLLPRDVTYDDFMDTIPNTLKECMILYRSYNHQGMKMKRMILSKMYPMMEKYKPNHTGVYMSMKHIVCKMGIIGEIDKKYKGFSHYKLKKYYDYCFEMMCYLVNSHKIQQYREEIKGE